MTPETVGPLSRLIDVMKIPPRGQEVHVEATAEECAALARDFGLPGIQALSGDYQLKASAKGIHVMGVVKASITQVCVMTLDPFDSMIEEEVEVDFAEPSGMPAEPPTDINEYEPPDEIVNSQIDLGALTAEFLALGLDPYPRKPGVDFSYTDPSDEKDTPFAALNKLKEGK
ncbi:DUF177 domain-containing protein [Microvirga sp. VF16]|uniref:YceD family protein n=1 Tax=Microvirga sp. VF16 TaxID=2807101 RepID=UPI00193D1602|nr:YceD family protein [Microvirga sp. VF16]QRM27499.1 DUF177 domain-containing protein [Microvirga sp. VF16]